ncbi:SAM-dependent methyltransferase [Streptomyces sp. NPDC005438]|uniref:SAM-dependent methyltransferase n=1 Tax=Streptomyces sp. NPDC005438 TaxID=3156880 RepID=UPI0033B4AD72
MDGFDAVARTALLTTALRARETARPDRLYEDPHAARLAGAMGVDLFDQLADSGPPSSPGPDGQVPNTVDYNAIRTRFFDEWLPARAGALGDRAQVVMVAAGMDTRAHRLPWPGPVRLFELDRAAVLEAKDAALADVPLHPHVTRHTVPADLTREDWPEDLRRAGYRPDVPSVWLLEGLLYYVPEEDSRALLDRVARMMAPGSELGADLVSASALTAPVMAPLLERFQQWGCPWVFGHDEPETFFAEHGLKVEALQPGEEGADYGRWADPVPPRDLPGVPRAFYVHGRRV